MAFTKITNAELNSRGATTLPNVPTIGATALKQEFDAPAKNVVAPKVNNLIDELQASTASADLGATAPTGRSGTSVQGVLNSLSADLGNVEASSHSHSNKTVIDKFDDDGTGLTYDGSPISGAVDSVNGQTGVVVLTATDVGALPDTTTVPTKTSDLVNDSNFVADASYVHTDNNYDADAVSKKHSHSNKTLLDTYAQSETDLADAVTKKHSHANKTVIDKFGEDSGGNPTYDGNPIGGGGSASDTFKNIVSGGTTFVASGNNDTFKINAGSNVTITALSSPDKGIQISATGGGQSTGDMLMAEYDNDSTIKNASSTGNGIKDYVASAISGKVDTAGDGLAKEGTTIALDLGMLTGSNLTKAVSGKDIKDALDEKADTSDIPTPAEKTAWDAKVSESLLDDTVGWVGKNNFILTLTSQTYHGVTYVVNADKTFSTSGTSNSDNRIEIGRATLKAGSYKTKGCPLVSAENHPRVRIAKASDDSVIAWDDGNGATFTLNADTDVIVYVRYANGVSFADLTFSIMIYSASITDDTYEPYHKSVEDWYWENNAKTGVHNLMPILAKTSKTVKDVDYSYSNDTVSLSGTTSGTGWIWLNNDTNADASNIPFKEGTYRVKVIGTLVDEAYSIQILDANNNRLYASHQDGNEYEFTIANDINIRYGIYFRASGKVATSSFKIMICLAEDTYEDYTSPAMTNSELTEFVKRTKLLGTDDLDTVFGYGDYYWENASPLHVPENQTFCAMRVYPCGEVTHQEIIRGAGGGASIYVRRYQNSWSSWYKFSGTVVS